MSLVGKMVSFEETVIARKGYNYVLDRTTKIGLVVSEVTFEFGSSMYTSYMIDTSGSGLYQNVLADKVKEYKLYDYEEIL